MSPNIQNLPISDKEIREKKVVFDVIMSPKETKFLNIGQNKGGEIVPWL